MPNQLAASKRRQSLAEHQAVLAALAAIARRENTTVMALMRQAGRALVRTRLSDPAVARALRRVVLPLAPTMPARFKSAAQFARFKRQQREFDEIVMDLQLASPAAVQARNSVFPSHVALRILELDHKHVTTPS
jgi:hypothetical protein